MLISGKNRKLNKALAQATTYTEWLSAAEALDEADGLMEWRNSDASAFIDENLLREHIGMMQALGEANDLAGLPALLQESVYRHVGELNNPELYHHARSGTKRIVTEYLDEVERVMRTLAKNTIPNMSESYKLQLFLQAERNYGCPALMLSGGAAFGIYHLGVVKALWEQGLLPKVLVGSSMGSIIAAAICNRSDAELDVFFKEQLQDTHLQALRWRKLSQMCEHGTAMDDDNQQR